MFIWLKAGGEIALLCSSPCAAQEITYSTTRYCTQLINSNQQDYYFYDPPVLVAVDLYATVILHHRIQISSNNEFHHSDRAPWFFKFVLINLF